MDRNQIKPGSLGLRLHSRRSKLGTALTAGREGWPSRSNPQTRLPNVALRRAEFRQFADQVERELNPRGPLERIVARHATRAAWELRHDLGAGGDPTDEDRSVTASAARTLKISITTLDLLQGRRGATRPATTVVAPAPAVDEMEDADEALLASNEWPVLPEAARSAHELDEVDEVDEVDDQDDGPIWHGRLVFDFDVSERSPVVRGTWITVAHLVNLIVDGATWADILRSHPELTEDDIRVCVAYAVAEENSVL